MKDERSHADRDDVDLVVLPEGWQETFFGQADLEAAYDRLEGHEHFFPEGLRGRIRSLQLRVDDAWDHFDEAVRRAADVEPDIQNLVRRLILGVHRLIHFLTECRLRKMTCSPGITENSDTSSPAGDLPPEVVRQVAAQDSRVRFALRLRQNAEGLVQIHSGEFERAESTFRALVGEEEEERPLPSTLASHYLGLGAALANQSRTDEARRQFENAGFTLQSTGHTLARVKVATHLAAFYDALGERESAKEWRAFVDQLPCPKETKKAFRKRGGLLVETGAKRRPVLLVL